MQSSQQLPDSWKSCGNYYCSLIFPSPMFSMEALQDTPEIRSRHTKWGVRLREADTDFTPEDCGGKKTKLPLAGMQQLTPMCAFSRASTYSDRLP